jgi:hypothetical protein
MWQSAQARPLPPSPARVRSWKFALPRQNALSTGAWAGPVSHVAGIGRAFVAVVDARCGVWLTAPVSGSQRSAVQALSSPRAGLGAPDE